MRPEDIREVFATKFDRKGTVEWGIICALNVLSQLPTVAARARSPYSIAKLTEGLPHQDEIIAMALAERAETQRVHDLQQQGSYSYHGVP